MRAPFPVIARLEAAVAHVADALAAQGHPGTLEELPVLAVLVLADPAEAVRLSSASHRADTETDLAEAGVSTDAPSLALGHCSTTEPHLVGIEKLLPGVVLYLRLTDHVAGDHGGVALPLADPPARPTSSTPPAPAASTPPPDADIAPAGRDDGRGPLERSPRPSAYGE